MSGRTILRRKDQVKNATGGCGGVIVIIVSPRTVRTQVEAVPAGVEASAGADPLIDMTGIKDFATIPMIASTKAALQTADTQAGENSAMSTGPIMATQDTITINLDPRSTKMVVSCSIWIISTMKTTGVVMPAPPYYDEWDSPGDCDEYCRHDMHNNGRY